MGNLTTALVFVLILNMLMFLTQSSMNNINPEETPVFYHKEGGILDKFGDEQVLNSNPIDNLPGGSATVEVSQGNFFQDMFASITNFFGKTLGLNYVVQIVSAPANIFKMMTGVPTEVSWVFGVIWYAITFFLIVSFMWGRDT